MNLKPNPKTMYDSNSGSPLDNFQPNDANPGLTQKNNGNLPDLNFGQNDNILDAINAGKWRLTDDKPLRLTDEVRANKFCEEVTRALTNYYSEKIRLSVEQKTFTGLYIYFEEMIEHFALTWQTPDPEDSSCEVTFSLSPYPFQHYGEWDAYGIIVDPNVVTDRHIKNMRIRPWLHGVDLLDREIDTDKKNHFVNIDAMKYVQYDGVDIGFDMTQTRTPWGEPSFHDLITVEPEIRWHRMVMQSVLHHYNCGDELTKPMQAFLDLARYNKIPDKEEFLKAVDKQHLMEALK